VYHLEEFRPPEMTDKARCGHRQHRFGDYRLDHKLRHSPQPVVIEFGSKIQTFFNIFVCSQIPAPFSIFFVVNIQLPIINLTVIISKNKFLSKANYFNAQSSGQEE
jgi:hypothetical protein